jgi:phosphatidylserine decarboxylase
VNDREPGLFARLYVAVQQVLPQHFLSLLMYGLARVQWAPVRVPLVWLFVRLTGIRMEEAAHPNPGHYPNLNALFTRALRPGLRPLDPDPESVVSPVDGTLSQIGVIEDGRLVQAKGHHYALRDLLGITTEEHSAFDGGAFATLYLSPKDYHRIHMPLDGDLAQMRHLDGRLFSVNAVTAALVPGLFSRNERVVCLFESKAGPMAMVLVAAIFVGGIDTVWAGKVTPAAPSGRRPRWNYDLDANRVHLDRGAEMGRFNLGSTVILLFPPGTVTWDRDLGPGSPVRVGQRIGRCNSAAG